MGTGYTRNDTVNNIADGNIINAADFDGEYDAIEAAFNSSTGHSHDGTSGEGGPVTVLGPAQDFVASTTEIKPKTTNTLDIGTNLLEFKDLYLAGTANVDGLAMPTTTVTDILDEDTMSSDSDSALATQQSIKAYVDSQITTADELSEVLANGNTTGGNNIDVDDNDRIRVGANPDLEIYHDTITNQSRIFAAGGGDLRIAAANLRLSATAGTETYLHGTANGAVDIYYDNAIKLSTATDGVDITGQLDISTDLNVTGDADIGDDLSLSSDGAIINLGADGEVTLTHQADIGVLLDVENSTTNGVTDVLKLQAKSTGTPAVGIGVGVEFSTETAASTIETGGVIESVATGLTPTAEEFDMVFKTMSAGATAAERLKLNGSGATIGNINVDGNTIISTDTNGDINLSPNGAGTVVVNTDLDIDNININGNAITSTDTNGNIEITPNGTGEVDITKVDIAGGEIDGTVIGANSAAAGTFTNLTASTDLTLASGATVTAILDEDDLTSNSDTALATQQSIKAYVDATISGGSFGSGITSGGNITLDDDGNSSPNGYAIVFKEASATYTTTFNKVTPTDNRIISLPDETGTVSTQAFANGAAVALAIALG